jgi:hypothetical protein
VSVKFADKPCSERMAIVQSCQVQMIKNLEVVGAFSAKKCFPEKIIFDDLLPPPSPKKFRLTFCGILFFVYRQIPSFADNLFSGGVPHPPIRDGPVYSICQQISLCIQHYFTLSNTRRFYASRGVSCTLTS